MRNLVILLALCCLLDNPSAQAQLFGRPRTVGRPLAGRSGPGSQQDAGTLRGSERFLRGNRGRAAFVGADQTEGQSFVGSQQARTSGTIVSSTAGLTPARDQSQQINRPLRVAAAGNMNLPKITLHLGDMSPAQSTGPQDSATTRVQMAMSLVSPEVISVSVIGRTAILRGVVRSDEERRFAETLASFEPGISSVRNLLRIPDSPLPAPLPMPPAVPSE